MCRLLVLCAFAIFFCLANAQSGCLVPNKPYTFPPTKIDGDYFQWLRQQSDSMLVKYFSTGTPAQLTDFMAARVAHIMQHINGTTTPHTVCLPQDFVNEAGHTDVAHWLIDYQFYHRLLMLLPDVCITVSLH